MVEIKKELVAGFPLSAEGRYADRKKSFQAGYFCKGFLRHAS
jgi:hypothetical protein